MIEDYYDRERILEDALDYNERKIMNRILYLISLLEKYTRPIEGCNIMKLISKDRNSIDCELVLEVLSTPLPLEKNIVEKSIKILNTFNEPLKLIETIMKKYLPTRYRFIPPTYYKQVLSDRPSVELEEYISNRFEQEPSHS